MHIDLEELAKKMFEQLGSSREAVSIACGYFPAWKQFELKDTYGLPIAVSAAEIYKRGLKVDWRGLQYEAAKRGFDNSSELHEAKREMQLAGFIPRDKGENCDNSNH